jgi:hypothetical protein
MFPHALALHEKHRNAANPGSSRPDSMLMPIIVLTHHESTDMPDLNAFQNIPAFITPPSVSWFLRHLADILGLVFVAASMFRAAGGSSIAAQHALNQIAQRTPVVFPATLLQTVFVHKEHIVLEACVEMRLQAQVNNDRIVMTVDMCVDAVQALEDVAHGLWEMLGERYADPAGKGGLVVNVGLHPGHEVLDVLGRRHLGRFRIAGRSVLPEIFESIGS